MFGHPWSLEDADLLSLLEEDDATDTELTLESPTVVSEATVELCLEQIQQENTLTFTYQDRECRLIVDEDTRFIEDHPQDCCHIFFRHSASAFMESAKQPVICLCLWAISQQDAPLFEMYPLKEKLNKLAVFSDLSPAQREYIRKRSALPKQPRNNRFSPITNSSGLQLLFDLCGETYGADVQAQAKQLLNEIQHLSYSQRGESLLRLSYMLNEGLPDHAIPNRSYDELKAIFDKHIFGMEPLKRVCIELILAFQRRGGSPPAVLLCGPPGVGKTSYARAFAEALVMPLLRVDCQGKDPLDIKGLVSSYSGAKPGAPARAFYLHGTKRVLLLFDELDKALKNEHGDSYSVVNTMVEEHYLHDEFVDVRTDTNDCFVIATGNDLDAIPDYIQSRFDLVLQIDSLGVEEKTVIGKEYILPNVRSKRGIGEDDLYISDEILQFMALRYCDDHGARKMRTCINSVFRAFESDLSRSLLSPGYSVTKEFVMERLDDLMLPPPKKHAIGITA